MKSLFIVASVLTREAQYDSNSMGWGLHRNTSGNHPNNPNSAEQECLNESELRNEGKMVRDVIKDELWSKGYRRPPTAMMRWT